MPHTSTRVCSSFRSTSGSNTRPMQRIDHTAIFVPPGTGEFQFQCGALPAWFRWGGEKHTCQLALPLRTNCLRTFRVFRPFPSGQGPPGSHGLGLKNNDHKQVVPTARSVSSR